MRTSFLSLFVASVFAAGCGSVSTNDDDDTTADANVNTADARPDAAPPPDAPPLPDAAPVECEDAEDCDDGVGCTDNECIGHHCFYTANDDNCDDDLFCNGVETCDEELDCQSGTAPTADDGVSCTDPFCNEDLDTIQQVPNDDYCSDGLFCNGEETCDAVLDCQDGTPPAINDGVDCTDDSCDEVNDKVVHAPNDDHCADDSYCNGDEWCDAQLDCQPPIARELDDGVDCTDDSCDEVNDKVVHTANNENCDDGAWCNGFETCDAVLDCQDGTPPDIDDGIDCTDDICDEDNDLVVNTENDANCDDGLFCNGEETCSAEISPETGEPYDCLPGLPPSEDDLVTCTADLCDEDTDSFTHEPNDFFCTDGDACTRDRCDATTGCSHSSDPICNSDCDQPVYDNGPYDRRGGFDADSGNLGIIDDFSLPSLGGTEVCTIRFTVLRDLGISAYQQVRIRIFKLGTDGLAGLGDFDVETPDFDAVFTSGDNLEIYDTGDDAEGLDVVDYVARLAEVPPTYTAGPNGYPDFGAGKFGLQVEFLDGSGEAMWATAPETGSSECSQAWGTNNLTAIDLCDSTGDTLPENLAFTILGPQPPPCTLEEGFESGGWGAGWILATGAAGAFSGSYAHDGSYGAREYGWHYNPSIPVGVPFSSISGWARGTVADEGRIYVGWNGTAAGARSFVIGWNTQSIIFQDNAGWGYAYGPDLPMTLTAGIWYYFEVVFMPGTEVIGRVLDGPGGTVLGELSYNYSSDNYQGGLTLRSFGGVDADTFRSGACAPLPLSIAAPNGGFGSNRPTPTEQEATSEDLEAAQEPRPRFHAPEEDGLSQSLWDLFPSVQTVDSAEQ